MPTISLTLIISSIVLYLIRCILNEKHMINRKISIILITIALLLDLLGGLLVL